MAAARFSPGINLVVLEIDVARLDRPPVWEDLHDENEEYPHVYQPIPRNAVQNILQVRWDIAGQPVFAATDPGVPPELTWAGVARTDETSIHILAWMNSQLIEDEGHDVLRDVSDLEARMRDFVAGVWEAWLLRVSDTIAGYALADPSGSRIFVRQFFIRRGYRRHGLGTAAFRTLHDHLGGGAVAAECLVRNEAGRRFWHSLGFTDRYVGMQIEVSGLSRRGTAEEPPDHDLRMEVVAGGGDAAARFLRENIRAFNDEVSPHHRHVRESGAVRHHAIMLTGPDGDWFGGISGTTYWNWLSVDNLWIVPGLRRRGFGSALLSRLQHIARSDGAANAELKTFSFQAREFYERHGYVVVGELTDYPPGRSFYWMKRVL